MGVSRKGSVGAVQLARMDSYAQQGGLLEGQQRQVMQNWLAGWWWWWWWWWG